MSDIMRTTKSGSEWTRNELSTYNILVKSIESKPFFGIELEEIEPPVDEVVMNFDYSTDEELIRLKEAKQLLQFLDLANMSPHESAVVLRLVFMH